MSISIVQLDSRAPAGQLRELLPQAEVVRFDEGEALPDVAVLTALVVLGGRKNAYDSSLRPVAHLLRRATDAQVKTLGICLGAQLLATSHGGAVEVAAPPGPERGIVEIRSRPGAEADPLLGEVVRVLGRDFCAVSMHDDAVTDLPAGATWLAASKQYPYQAFRLGSALGVQFHPEADAEIYGQWLNRETGIEPAVARAQWRVRGSELSRLAAAFASGMGTARTERSR